jgi:hypothetical protein
MALAIIILTSRSQDYPCHLGSTYHIGDTCHLDCVIEVIQVNPVLNATVVITLGNICTCNDGICYQNIKHSVMKTRDFYFF